MTTKIEILSLLQREALTVAELCIRLGVTRNAIIVQLKQLEAEGLVLRGTVEHRGTLGKPAFRYEAAPGSEDSGSTAYQLFLLGLLKVIQKQMGNDVLGQLLEETGRHLAREAGLHRPRDFEKGLKAAMAAANSLGADTEAIAHKEGVVVRNFSCPLGAAVRAEPCTCRALASFFSEATGRPATELCLRDGRLLCQYLIKTPRKRSKPRS